MIHGATIDFCRRLNRGLNRFKNFPKSGQKSGALVKPPAPAQKADGKERRA